jgi:hypothetical protein
MRALSILALLGAVALGGTVVAAFGSGFGLSELALGTVRPTPATADLTCYALTPDVQLASANTSRPDILATFVRAAAPGRDAEVCFLRPPTSNGGEWAPPAPAVSAPAPVDDCSAYPGFVPSLDGGCVPPSHPRARP